MVVVPVTSRRGAVTLRSEARSIGVTEDGVEVEEPMPDGTSSRTVTIASPDVSTRPRVQACGGPSVRPVGGIATR